MAKSFFITGTDTDVGKTFVAVALLTAARLLGLSTAAIKPVAAGCQQTSAGLRNSDALQLQAAMTRELSYEQVNPVALKSAIAPHIAAGAVRQDMSVSSLGGLCRKVMLQPCDIVLVEGAGGWRVPLNATESLSDLARALRLEVILVVGMRLGCINHAILTAEAIMRDGLKITGWVANRIDPEMSCYQENLDSIKQRLPFPCIGEIPFLSKGSHNLAASYIDIRKILNNIEH